MSLPRGFSTPKATLQHFIPIAGLSIIHKSLECVDVLEYPARFLLDLPLTTLVTIDLPKAGGEFIWITCPFPSPRQVGSCPVFDRMEILSLIYAAEIERALPRDMVAWYWQKCETPDFILNDEIVLEGIEPGSAKTWNLVSILEWYEMSIISLQIVEPFGIARHSKAEAA